MSSHEGALARKIAEVVTAVEGVEKDARNDFHKYDYTSAEAMLRALRKPLAERHVALLCSLTAIDDREYKTTKGNASTITTAHVAFTFIDGETGAMFKCDWAGRGDDAADKGLGKAYTNAIKTFLREQFLIPQGDDPEADSATDRRAQDRAPANGNGQAARRVRADAPKPTEPVATAAQRGLINAKASERGMLADDLANVLRVVAGQEAKEFDGPDDAAQFVNRFLSRMPTRLVDPVLDAIGQSDPVAA